jgi:hypothetical protein
MRWIGRCQDKRIKPNGQEYIHGQQVEYRAIDPVAQSAGEIHIGQTYMVVTIISLTDVSPHTSGYSENA